MHGLPNKNNDLQIARKLKTNSAEEPVLPDPDSQTRCMGARRPRVHNSGGSFLESATHQYEKYTKTHHLAVDFTISAGA
jgi:hypothetical protein